MPVIFALRESASRRTLGNDPAQLRIGGAGSGISGGDSSLPPGAEAGLRNCFEAQVPDLQVHIKHSGNFPTDKDAERAVVRGIF